MSSLLDSLICRFLSRPATGRVDHLARNPLGLVGDQPGDQASGIVRLAPAALGFCCKDRVKHLGGRIAGIRRPRVNGVHGDTPWDQVGRQAEGELVQRALGWTGLN